MTLAMNTGMRRGEILGLTWAQVDFLNERLTVGKSKTAAGQGRNIPLNATALAAIQTWATNFPARQPKHFVFASERYGLAATRRTHTRTRSIPKSRWAASRKPGSRRSGGAG